jgi:phosphatidylinositol glycan class A protein
MSLSSQPQPRPLNIALVSDFFYPNLGGVEMHIYSLAYCLMERGNKVIILTRAYENRQGIRYISNGIKCYYLPLSNWPIGTIIFPAVVLGVNYLLIRDIFFREKIDICHCHQSTSTLVIDITNIAYNLGVRTVLTDHSTWNLHDFGYIDISKLWKVCSMVCDHYIAVSHAVRENFVVRSNLDPVRTSTIPNAIDTSKFKPDPTKRNPLGTINIVVMSRLEYKKGFDLLVEAIPAICKKYPNAYWIIGGDGSKMPVLKFLVKKCGLESQVEILGMVPHHLVQDVLNRGHIFINTSIAEAFCIAVLEAVACGLK